MKIAEDVIQCSPPGQPLTLGGWKSSSPVWRRINAERPGFSGLRRLFKQTQRHRFQFHGLLIRVNFTLSL